MCMYIYIHTYIYRYSHNIIDTYMYISFRAGFRLPNGVKSREEENLIRNAHTFLRSICARTSMRRIVRTAFI